MHPRAPVIVLLGGAALLGACGGGSGEPAAPAPPAQAAQPAEPVVPGGSLAIPKAVPLRASRRGDPAAIKVIRLWTEALRRSDVERASALWAVPAKAQNGTPVLTLATRRDVRLFNESLSCGSQLVSALGARNSFTIAVFKLTNRPGADCGSGIGHDARTAILVREGRIVEWYRLPDDPDAPAPPGAPAQPPAPPAAPVEPDGPII